MMRRLTSTSNTFRLLFVLLLLITVSISAALNNTKKTTATNANTTSELPKKAPKLGVELHLDTAVMIPASDTLPEHVQVSSTLINNSPFTISYQTGCNTAPQLYAQASSTSKLYKLLPIQPNGTTLDSGCIASEQQIVPNQTQSLSYNYQVNGHNGDTGMLVKYALTSGSYTLQQNLTYTIQRGDKKTRYKTTDGASIDSPMAEMNNQRKTKAHRAIVDTFVLTHIESNTIPFVLTNSQNASSEPVVLAAQVSAQSVVSFALYNNNTGQPISQFNPLQNGAVITLSTLPTKKLNVRAYTTPTTVGSVVFGYDTKSNYRTTNQSPYFLSGSSWTPTVGTHTIKATPYSNRNGQGTAGSPKTITFTVVNTGPTATKTPTPSLTPTPTPIPTNTPTPTSTPTPTPAISLSPTVTPSTPYPYNSQVGPFSPKVLVIDYNSSGTPDDGSNTLTGQLISAIHKGSQYHGDQFASANLSVYQTYTENNPPPLNALGRADYPAIYAKYDVCNLAANQGVNFVWIWASGDVNNYAGTFFEWVATGPTFHQTYDIVVSTCPNTVVTLGLNYNRSIESAMHSFGHYTENVGYYAFGPIDYANVNATDMWDLFDGQLQRMSYSYTPPPINTTSARCGNVHFPPNATNHYEYSNTTTVVQSECATYNPGNPSSQVYVPVSINTWRALGCDPSIQNDQFNCDHQAYLTWWMQNFPGYNNTITDLNHDPMPNWWQYLMAIDTTVRYN